MRPGRHAAEDGSFRRSAGMAVGRAALLLLVAVVLGVFLLNQIDDAPETTVDQTSDVTEPDDDNGATPTTAPTTSTTVRAAKDPATVKVLAVNGTTQSGIGARTKEVLQGAKYNALAPTDAAAKLKPVKTTVIYYQPGFDVDALAIAQLFQLTVANTKPMPQDMATQVVASRNVAASNIVVIAGEDIVPKLPAATTTTTAARSNTTTTRRATTTSSTTSTTARP